MVTAVDEIMVDWGATGLFGDGANDDITGDVMRAEWQIGRDFASMLTGRSRGGRALITLNNDRNDGKYNSFNTASALTGSVLPGRRVRIREGRGGYSTVVLADSPAGYWRFNESSGAAQDATANNNDGTVTGATQNANSLIIEPTGAGITLGGSTGDINVTDAAAIQNIFDSDGSLDVWVEAQTDGENSFGRIFDKGAWRLFVELEAGGKMGLNFYYDFSGTDGNWRTTNLELTANQPHHIALTFNNTAGNVPIIYVDSILVILTTLSTSVGTRVTDVGTDLVIGNRAADDRTFDGTIDEPALYSDILTAAEVLDHYTAGGVIQWQGFLDRINPQVSVSSINTALLEAIGPLAWLSRADFELFLPLLTDETSGVIIDALLDAVSWPAGDRDVDTGKSTIRQRYFSRSGVLGTRDRKVTFLSAARKIEDTENGFLHESKDAKVIFEDRDRRIQSATATRHNTSQDTFSDSPGAGEITYGRIVQGDPLKQIFNIFTTNIQNYTVGAVQDIWIHPEAVASGADIPQIPAGESRIYVALVDPTATYELVSVWTTPVATTDYTANAQADGLGSDLTSDVGIAVTKTGLSMIITVTNNHATDDMFLTLLKARGAPLNLDNPVLVFAQDLTSQGKFGRRQFPVPAELVRDTVEGKDHVDWLLSVYADPRPQLDITVIGNKDADHLSTVLRRDISDLVTIEASAASTDLGINTDFFIESMRHTVVPGTYHTVVYSCSSLEIIFGFWALDKGKLATTSALHY